MNRRRFLGSALAAGAFALSGGGTRAQDAKASRRFFPVQLSRDRLIRTVVGLRPYRSEGFVLRLDRLGEKNLIHNYGHGGAGVTLSWGVATLALEAAQGIEYDRAAVLGCGVIGLSTARLLQRRGKAVTIYARDLPPDTTSNVAGAFWYPTSVYDAGKASPEFLEQFRRACRISNQAFQILVGPEFGVRWIDSFDLQRDPAMLDRGPVGGAELYPGIRLHHDEAPYFGFPHVREFSTLLIEPHTYLHALQRDFHLAGGRIVVRELRDREAISALPEKMIFNCTGLGAGAIFDDAALIPVRGQLEVLLPQPEIDYCYLQNDTYMFPRRDGIILGGSFEHGNMSLAPDPALTTRILDAHAAVMGGLRG